MNDSFQSIRYILLCSQRASTRQRNLSHSYPQFPRSFSRDAWDHGPPFGDQEWPWLMIHNYASVMKTLLTWMLPQVVVHEVLILNWKRLIYYVKFFLCVSLIGLWAFKFLLRTKLNENQPKNCKERNSRCQGFSGLSEALTAGWNKLSLHVFLILVLFSISR